MKVIIRFSFLITLFWMIPAFLQGQDSSAGPTTKMEIPDEIISRIPESEVAQFLLARQRVLNKKGQSDVNVFEEIGITKEVLSRIPSGDLFEFLIERGYVEIEPHEHIGDPPDPNAPTPQQMISLLYTLLFVFAGLLLTSMLLNFWLKKSDQKIIIKSLENEREIPLEQMQATRQRSYLTYSILFTALGIGFIVLGAMDFFPPSLAIIPFSLALGYFIIRYANNTLAK